MEKQTTQIVHPKQKKDKNELRLLSGRLRSSQTSVLDIVTTTHKREIHSIVQTANTQTHTTILLIQRRRHTTKQDGPSVPVAVAAGLAAQLVCGYGGLLFLADHVPYALSSLYLTTCVYVYVCVCVCMLCARVLWAAQACVIPATPQPSRLWTISMPLQQVSHSIPLRVPYVSLLTPLCWI